MKITQLRSATIVVSYGQYRILLDPMLAPQGTLLPFKWFTGQRRRNPIVALPAEASVLLPTVTHALITHCQRGHVDHLDRTGTQWLHERQIPVLCMPEDVAYLARRGLRVQPLQAAGATPFGTGHITPIPCLHGEGWIGRFMAHGHGYFIEQAGEPSLYIAGDTVLTDEVRRCVAERRPDVSVVPAGGAAMDLGSELIMDAEQMLTLAAMGRGVFIANHLEALDHCPVTRATLRAEASRRGLGDRVLVPEDGQTMEFTAYSIIAARPRDIQALAAIERAAATLLAGHAPESALNDTTDEATFLEARTHGRLWVALIDDVPVGFALVEMLDHGLPHLEEIDVLPEHGRRGIGTALVSAACAWASQAGHSELTLTTFRHLPWNEPFYARLGFREVPDDHLSPHLAAIVDDETARGFDPSRRVVMRYAADDPGRLR
jgi:L-ascorbate metabolism protein UlaG (beta-lactamase superfamily)